MRPSVILFTATLTLAAGLAHADECRLKPKEVVTKFMNEFYVQKQVRTAFETWVEPGYVQHNPLAATGRDAAVAFLEPFFRDHPDANYSIKRIIAEGNLVVVHSHAKFTAGDRGLAVVDILRVEHCKIAEHWDVAQPVPEKPANANGMF
ncbi:MAG: polyketide cyclase [Gammaproteobacteria bacterium]|nr:MAG: polyketide cyclase [Gammaproteobacteria bacterium]TLZ07847.1 MAG: polyketide cyclase [Gammaproteobacteria bacterium]TLZ15339.1 MAG: polyketide cyclase [Gammaproteobacteria bacterium]TLZ18712.1 MAG: polyketide cyclase [Gammaproteobacteria bacterium]